jgi:predicted component of viral defense system (DUF524 family)
VRVHRPSDGAVPPIVGGAWSLDAESTWIVEGTPGEVDQVVADLGGQVCQRLASGVASLRFGNSVGLVARAGALGPLVVHSGKWTEEHYDLLLEDLSRVSAALPFAPVAASSLPYERTVVDPQDVLYHAFVWLRHALLREHDTELHDAIEGLLRNPHRRLVRTSREVPVELAGRVGARAMMDIASGRWPLSRSPLGFPSTAGAVLPMRVSEDLARDSVDTAENRFVKAFLDEGTWIVGRIRRHLGDGTSPLAVRVRTDCERLTAILTSWRRAAMWEAVGTMTHFPASSSVLQRRREYRTVLRHHMMLRLGSRVPLDRDTSHKLLESKDIATLYELWAAVTVLAEVTALLGPPEAATRIVTDHRAATMSWGLLARWRDGTEVAYNHTYTRTSGFHGTARSLRLRPDVALFVPAGPHAGLHLFDAKFRLEGTLADVEDDDTSFKSSDLHKMHAYRDAIPTTRSAWVLYPGAEGAAYFDDGRHSLADLAGGPLAGVGALPLRPGGGRESLRAVLATATGLARVERTAASTFGNSGASNRP